MNPAKSVVTLTFGDSAENHVGMEKIGTLAPVGGGFRVGDLQAIQAKFPEACDIHILRCGPAEAAVLVFHGGVDHLLGEGAHAALFEEQVALEVDKKAFMYGRVVDKHARWNLCFDDVGHEPDYPAGKGCECVAQRLCAVLYKKFYER